MDQRYEQLSAYKPDDVERVAASELEQLTKYTSHARPTAILLAGQPGAGKTLLSAMQTKRFRNDVYFINGDEYRSYHPNKEALYRQCGADAVPMTAAFSGAVTERLIQAASDRKINLIIEGTGRTTEVPHRTAALLVEKGYQVELSVLAARPEQSLCSTLLRFYAMEQGGATPRATAVSAHDRVVERLPDNLDSLRKDPVISQLTIWDRALHMLYPNEAREVPPSQALRSDWYRTWSREETAKIQAAIALLRQKEDRSRLGQRAAIDALEARVQAITSAKE